MSEKNISVVVPLFNEEESLPELTEWIARVMNENNFSYEIILVDDGSKDKSWSVIEQLAEKNKNIRGIKFRRNNGKSAALQKGFELASGKVVITMDADLQDSPDEIPSLYKMIAEDGNDLVFSSNSRNRSFAGWPRPDSIDARTSSIEIWGARSCSRLSAST